MYIRIFSCLLLIGLTVPLIAQEVEAIDAENEVLGDNFSLEGALEMFKTSQSLEEFEEKLNDENNSVNNLDLNEDGSIDYIRVIDNVDEDQIGHAIVLQVPVSVNESQDIAVIAIEKVADEDVVLQIIGDELLYGENHMVEPFEEESQQTEERGPSAADLDIRLVRVNVWNWSLVRFIYRPNYVRYSSPWGWNRYPRAWRPWRPVSVTVFRPRVTRYRRPYRVTRTHRVVRTHNIYKPRRKSSSVVVSRRSVRTNRGVKTNTRVRVAKPGRTKTTSRTVKKRRGRRN